jgi:cytochrome P450
VTRETSVEDVFHPAIYAQGIPYDTYARLRATTPVSWHAEPALPGVPAGTGFWAVMRYDDVVHVSKTPELFSASLGCTQLRDPAPEDLGFLRAMLLNMDPPAHNPMRKTVSHLFTPRSIKQLEPYILQTTDRLVARAREQGEFDLTEDVTDLLALSTLARVLGIPASDQRLFFDWANRIIGYQDDEYGSGADADPRSPSSLNDMYEYADALREYRLRHPGDDVISALVHAQVNGEAISDAEFKNFFFLLAVAGNDTTRSALPGGIIALLEHPDQFALLRREPQLIDSAVEECLRFAPPVILFRRTATRPTTLRGVQIDAGDKVVVFYPAANRDPLEFADPETFQITRSPNHHVSFGHGPHVCVAAGLARMQLRAMFTAIATQMPGLVQRGPVERLASNLVAGIKRAPVSVG